MSTMKVVHEAHEEGIKIVGYESWCGGLPAAEHTDNPLGYKFSWNPGAAIKASKNMAIFMKDGKKVTLKDCLKSVTDCDDFSYALKMEGYANRDSTVFMKGFEMEDCDTFMRGTLRFKGFCSTI